VKDSKKRRVRAVIVLNVVRNLTCVKGDEQRVVASRTSSKAIETRRIQTALSSTFLVHWMADLDQSELLGPARGLLHRQVCMEKMKLRGYSY
jgi:hypothetical protein